MSRDLSVTSERTVWRGWLTDFEDHDPRDRPEYLEVACRLDPGEPLCARFVSGDGLLLFPFVRRSIPGHADIWDLTTAYDFGGYLLDCRPPAAGDLIDAFRDEWRRWCREHRIVSEFVRLHPLRRPSTLATTVPSRFRHHQDHAVIELHTLPEEPSDRYVGSHRRNLAAGRRAGLRCQRLSRGAWSSFAGLYRRTMTLRGAPAYYHFPGEFFDELAAHVAEVELFGVPSGDRLAAAALFLVSGRNLFYFLGGSDPELLALRPNNVLFDGVIRWAREAGFERLHLGGGSESLRRFKMGFGARPVPYYVHAEIHDAERYAQLVAETRGEAYPSFFPQHRAGQFFGGAVAASGQADPV